MTIKSTLYKNQGGPDFTTPTQGYVRNVSLGYHKSPPAGKIRPSKVYWVPKGKTAGEEFYSFTGAPHEFDVDIPGTGTPVEWLQAGSHSLIEDYTTCTPAQAEMEIAEFRSKIEPALIQNIISDVVRCEMMGIYQQQHPHGEGVGTYDAAPQTEDEEVAIALAVSDKIGKDAQHLAQNQLFLADIAKKAGIKIGWVQLWTKGPQALLDGLKYGKLVPPHWAKPTVKASAMLLGKDVIALNEVSQDASGTLYLIGEHYGPEWNDFLEAALVEHDLQVAAAPPTPISAFKAGGTTVYQLGWRPGKSTTKAPVKKAAAVHEMRKEKVIIRRELHRKNIAQEARDHNAFSKRADDRKANTAVKDAIAWFLTCSPPGKVQTFPLAIGEVTVICGDLDSFERLNTPEIYNKLHAELAEQTGEAPPPPVNGNGNGNGAKGSPLPWILAAAGLMFGGPLGAGAGFAIGKSMEDGDAGKTV
tara:strand:- start:2848 stop:4263 length:1416 start_codon:yes stop_codon:yes gene_type:complete